MSTKRLITALIAVLAIAVGAWVFLVARSSVPITTFEECAAKYPVMESYPEQCNTPDGKHFVRDISGDLNDLIQVNAPVSGATISSPLVVTGKARGTWYFEASFPVKLLDATGNVIAEAPAQAQGEWMTNDFVPFKVVLTFKSAPFVDGSLVLKNDNPSGDPAKDKQIIIPVKFSADQVSNKYGVFGKAVTLNIRDNVLFPDGLIVGLDKINDSRCQQNVQCIWAGELAPLLIVDHSEFNPGSQEVQLGMITHQTVAIKGYTIKLQSAATAQATIVVTADSTGNGLSGINGYVHIGPTCPVERTPPDSNCADRPDANAQIVIRKSNNYLVTTLMTDASGKFSAPLAAGYYILEVSHGGSPLPRCDRPTPVVNAGTFTSVDIACDSGIR